MNDDHDRNSAFDLRARNVTVQDYFRRENILLHSAVIRNISCISEGNQFLIVHFSYLSFFSSVFLLGKFSFT